jgi:hypothetical protein
MLPSKKRLCSADYRLPLPPKHQSGGHYTKMLLTGNEPGVKQQTIPQKTAEHPPRPREKTKFTRKFATINDSACSIVRLGSDFRVGTSPTKPSSIPLLVSADSPFL